MSITHDISHTYLSVKNVNDNTQRVVVKIWPYKSSRQTDMLYVSLVNSSAHRKSPSFQKFLPSRNLLRPSTFENSHDILTSLKQSVNHLMGTLKPQSNGSLYSNTVIGIHWPLMGGLLHLTQRGGAWAPSPLLAVPNVTAHPSTASACTNFIIN